MPLKACDFAEKKIAAIFLVEAASKKGFRGMECARNDKLHFKDIESYF
jgi:hypothetical protein